MRVRINRPYIQVRAGISDYLFSLQSQFWKTDVSDEPGATEFRFLDHTGELGSLRIHVVQSDKTMFTTHQPYVVHEQGLIDLILSEKFDIALDDYKVLMPVLQFAARRKEEGVDNWDIKDYFRETIQHEPRPLNTEQERKAARPILDKYLQRLNSHKQDQHKIIIDAIIFDLRVQGIWELSELTPPKYGDKKIQMDTPEHTAIDGECNIFNPPLSQKPDSKGQPGRPKKEAYEKAWLIYLDGGLTIEARNDAWNWYVQNSTEEIMENYDKASFLSAMGRRLKKWKKEQSRRND